MSRVPEGTDFTFVKARLDRPVQHRDVKHYAVFRDGEATWSSENAFTRVVFKYDAERGEVEWTIVRRFGQSARGKPVNEYVKPEGQLRSIEDALKRNLMRRRGGRRRRKQQGEEIDRNEFRKQQARKRR